MIASAMTLLVSDASKQYGGEVPTMVLSETRGLSLFLVVRGGIRLIQRLAVLEGTLSAVTGLWILTLEPERQ